MLIHETVFCHMMMKNVMVLAHDSQHPYDDSGFKTLLAYVTK